MATGSGKPEDVQRSEVCHFYNMPEGCWYGDRCHFLHVPIERPKCKYFRTAEGCRYGDECFFRHDSPEGDTNNNAIPAEDKKDGDADEREEGELSPDVKPKDQEVPVKDSTSTEKCSLCQDEVSGPAAGSITPLHLHYMEKLGKGDRLHNRILSKHQFDDDGADCSICDRFFDHPRHLMQHLKSKSLNKRPDVDHKDFFKDIVTIMIAKDKGEISEKKAIKGLKKRICTTDFKPYERQLSYHLKCMANMSPDDYDDEIEERCMNGGFLEDEIEELLCQGVKPWDEDAWLVLDALYD